MNISKYISYNEATKSQTAIKLGIDNTPNEKQLEAMKYVASFFDKIREHVNSPLEVPSFFRCKPLNKAVGGSDTSFHPLGAAIDIDGDKYGVSNAEIFWFIVENLPFTELIWEFGTNQNPDWVHYGLVEGRENEKVVKVAVKVPKEKNGKTIYVTDYIIIKDLANDTRVAGSRPGTIKH